MVVLNSLSANPTKWLNYTQAISRQQLTNCLSVFDHFEGWRLKVQAVNYFCKNATL